MSDGVRNAGAAADRVQRHIIITLWWLALLAAPAVLAISYQASGVARGVVLAPVGMVLVASYLLMRRHYRADIALLTTGVITGVSHVFFGSHDIEMTSGVIVVVAGALATMFVPSFRRSITVTYGLFTCVLAWGWGDTAAESLLLMLTMTGSFALGAFSLYHVATTMQSTSRALQQSGKAIDEVPVAVFEEDFSELQRAFRQLRAAGVVDLGAYLEAQPDQALRLMRLITVVSVNRAAEDLFQVPTDSLLGPLRVDDEHSRNLEAYVAELTALWDGRVLEGSQNFDLRIGGEKRTVAVKVLSDGLRSGEFTSFVAITDVTELIAARDALSKLNRAKDEFIASISHELRTPLTAVLGFASELRGAAADVDSAERETWLSCIVEQSREMAYIVEDLLVEARADIGAVAISPVVSDIGSLVAGTLQDLSVQLPVEAPDDPVYCDVDPVRFRQIVRNLVTNAQRYGGPNRWVTLDIDGETVHVEVHDDGPGVPDDMAERIFETFVSAHAPRAATASVGLGLSVSRYLARRMGGDLVYRSGDESSVFTLTLPRVEASVPSAV